MITKRILLLSALCFLGLQSSFGQFGIVWDDEYQHTTAGNFSNEARKIACDASGNTFVLADVTSNIDASGNTSASTHHYAVLIKYGPTGYIDEKAIEVFNHLTSGFDNLGAFGLEIDAAGDVYIGYGSYSAVSNHDIRIAKYDNNLNEIYTASYNAGTLDAGVDMKVSDVGSVYAIIRSYTGANFQFHLLRNNGGPNMNVLWSSTTNTQVISSMALEASQVYVTGYNLAGGFKQALVARIYPMRSAWSTAFNGGTTIRDDYGTDIELGANGTLFVAGTSDRGLPTKNDAMVLKFTTSGKFEWVAYFDNNNSNLDAGLFMNTRGPANSVYMGGQFDRSVFIEELNATTGAGGGTNPTPAPIGSGNDLNRAVYSPLPQYAYTGLGTAVLTDMKISANNRVYLTGNISATGAGGQFNASFLIRFRILPAGARSHAFDKEFDYFVEGNPTTSLDAKGVGLDYFGISVVWMRSAYSTYSTHQNEFIRMDGFEIPLPLKSVFMPDAVPASSASLYPNPVVDQLMITSVQVIDRVEITDPAGRIVQVESLRKPAGTMDVRRLPSGAYTSRIYFENGTAENRILIKQND